MNTPPRFEMGFKNGLRLAFKPEQEALVIEMQQGTDEPMRLVLDDSNGLLDLFLSVLAALKREGH
jgi:hypothetical protein